MAETRKREKYLVGLWLLERMRLAKGVYDLQAIGKDILELIIEDELAVLVTAWQQEWKRVTLDGIQDEHEKEFSEQVLADLREQEVRQRAAIQGRLDALRASTAALERLVTRR